MTRTFSMETCTPVTGEVETFPWVFTNLDYVKVVRSRLSTIEQWNKGDWSGPNSMCLGQALKGIISPAALNCINLSCDALVSIIQKRLNIPGDFDLVAYFNDLDSTTFADLQSVLEEWEAAAIELDTLPISEEQKASAILTAKKYNKLSEVPAHLKLETQY